MSEWTPEEAEEYFTRLEEISFDRESNEDDEKADALDTLIAFVSQSSAEDKAKFLNERDIKKDDNEQECDDSRKVKGLLIYLDGCIWKMKEAEMTFDEFADELHKFAESESGYASPYITDRKIKGKTFNFWYDENGMSYSPAPSAICLDSKNIGEECFLGMLFIAGQTDEDGYDTSLTEEDIKMIKEQYHVPDIKDVRRFGQLGLYMLGFNLVHYDY